MPPIIGITASRGLNSDRQPTSVLNEAYSSAISSAGGVPVLVPSDLAEGDAGALLRRLDGILLSGGGDIDPKEFRDQGHPKVEGVEPRRDRLELQLLHAAIGKGTPILGICRGCQLMNVGLGGTLHTHIPDQIPGALEHDQPGSRRKALVHRVRLEEGSRLGEIMGAPILEVNSHHHQGLKVLGKDLRPVGFASDGLIEAIELPGNSFVIAVQWHPEWLTDQEPTRRLFGAFVEAAEKYGMTSAAK